MPLSTVRRHYYYHYYFNVHASVKQLLGDMFGLAQHKLKLGHTANSATASDSEAVFRVSVGTAPRPRTAG